MNMKKLIETVDECSAMPAQPPQDQGNPVTMSVNLSATGKQHVDDLVNMMKNAGLGDAKPVSTDMMPMRTDMEKFRGIVDSESVTNEGSGSFEDLLSSMPKDVAEFKRTGELTDDLYQAAYDYMFQNNISGGKGDPYEQVAAFVNDYIDVDEGYDNEPDEDYRDTNYMIKDLSGGINKEKRMYKSAQPGDNAMTAESIRDQLYKTLAEKKSKPDYLDLDKDGDKKEPMKKAAADKKKGAVGKKKTNEAEIDDYLDKKKSVAKDTSGRRKHSGSRYGGSAQKSDSDTDAFGDEVSSKKEPARKKTKGQKVDELSKDTLQSYLDKSGKSMKTAADFDKRLPGRIKAGDRVMKKTDWDSELKKADASRNTKEASVMKTKPIVVNRKQVDPNSIEFSIYGADTDQYEIEDARFVDGTPLSDQEIEQLYRNETVIDLHQDELQNYHSGSDSKLNRESTTNEASDYMDDLVKFAKVVRSATTPEQLKTAQRMGSLLLKKYQGTPTSKLDKVASALGHGTFGSDLDRYHDVEDEIYRKSKDLGVGEAAIDDYLDKTKSSTKDTSGRRKHSGSRYGGSRQKDDADTNAFGDEMPKSSSKKGKRS